MRLMAFAVSMRKASFNKLLIDEAVDLARELGATVNLFQFNDFEMPMYDGDLESEIVLPTGVRAMAKHMMSCDGLLISTPEYNHGMPGTFKNAVDWLSRPKPSPLVGKTCFLMSASPSLIGGQRGLWHSRQPLESIGTIIHPTMYSLPQADKAFDSNGRLVDDSKRQRLKSNIAAFLKFAEALAVRPTAEAAE